MNYESANGSLPPAGLFNSGNLGFSSLVRIDPFLEQNGIYNATNFSLAYFFPDNWTIAGTVHSALFCLSDPSAFQPNAIEYGPPTFSQYHNQYSGVVGPSDAFGAVYGPAGAADDPLILAYALGAIISGGRVTIASITDGTRSKMMYAENGHGVFSTSTQGYLHQGNAGEPSDWCLETRFPPNWGRHDSDPAIDRSNTALSTWAPYDAMSFHPGGVNSAFCDGSVHFPKDSIQSWIVPPPQVNGMPQGMSRAPASSTYGLLINPGAQVGVYQKLSTRADGEVISADQY